MTEERTGEERRGGEVTGKSEEERGDTRRGEEMKRKKESEIRRDNCIHTR